jgi:AcrR family transcriptional regulator
MAPDDRRARILEATLPLLREHGPQVTTSQIAQAAGVAEGTLFRVFPGKRELLLAALESAMSADAEVARIAEIPLDCSLEERLSSALAASGEYQERLWSLIRALRDTGWQPDGAHAHEHQHQPRHQMERIGVAIARLLEPERARLRQEPCVAARLLLGLAFANRIQSPDEATLSPVELVELFLHGALEVANA